MNKQIQPLNRSGTPILLRLLRGHMLFWWIIGGVMLLRWLGDISPINIDEMADGWGKTASAWLAGILTIAITFFGLPLLLHELAVSVVAVPTIKKTLERQIDSGPNHKATSTNQDVENDLRAAPDTDIDRFSKGYNE